MLIVLLSSGAAQSLSGQNTVFGDDIKDGEITNVDIHDGAIISHKVKDETLQGVDIKNETLTGADVQDGSLGGSDIDESTLVLTCVNGMTQVGSLCIGPKEVDNQGTASFDCADQLLRLPAVTEARIISKALDSNAPLWTDVTYFDTANDESKYRAVQAGTVVTNFIDATSDHAYRCVTDAGARP